MRISDWSSDVCSSDLVCDKQFDGHLVLPVVSQWRERYLWLAHLAIAQDRHGVVRDALGQGGMTLNRGAEGQLTKHSEQCADGVFSLAHDGAPLRLASSKRLAMRLASVLIQRRALRSMSNFFFRVTWGTSRNKIGRAHV